MGQKSGKMQEGSDLCSDEIFRTISGSIGKDAKVLGRALGIGKAALECAVEDESKKGLEQVTFNILDRWRRLQGDDATENNLGLVLLQIERTDIVSKIGLRDIITKNDYRSSDIRSSTSPLLASSSCRFDSESVIELTDSPVNSDVLMVVKKHLGHQWKDLGRKLGVEEGKMDHLEIDNRGNISEAIFQMLFSWQNKNKQAATVDILVDSLKFIERDDIADKIWAVLSRNKTQASTEKDQYAVSPSAKGTTDLDPFEVQDTSLLDEVTDSSTVLVEQLRGLTLNEHSREVGPAIGLSPTLLEQRVLDCLAKQDKPAEARKLALILNMHSKKDMNSALYSLMRQGHIKKSNDVPPMWAFDTDPRIERTLSQSTLNLKSYRLEANNGDNNSNSTWRRGGIASGELSEGRRKQLTSLGLSFTASTPSLNTIESQPKLPDSELENEAGPSEVNDKRESSTLEPSKILVASASYSQTDITPPLYSEKEIQEMVLDYMGKAQKKTVSPLELVRDLGLPNKQGANRALYNLERQGLVIKIHPKQWSLRNLTPSSSLKTLHRFS